MQLVIEELEEMLVSAEMDGESEGEFATELKQAIEILKNT